MVCPAVRSKIFQIFNATIFGEPLVEIIGSSILTFLYEKNFCV